MRVQRRDTARLAAAAALASALSVAAAPARMPARDLFDELYARGQKQNASLRTFTAAFAEETVSALLTRPLAARGTVAVERPSRIALRYLEPEARTVIIDGDRMTVSWPSRNILQTRDIGASQKRVQNYFVESSPAELRSHFQIGAEPAADRPGYLVTMTPRRRQIRDGLTRLHLWIDPETLLLTGMKMTFPNGDHKVMTFTDVRQNAPLGPAEFRLPGQ